MSDYIIKATAAEGQIRAYVASTKEMVAEAQRRHMTTPPATAALGRLMTAGAMMGAMLKSKGESVTLKIEGNGPIGFVIAVADAEGNVKGYPGNPTVMLQPNQRGKINVAGAIGIGLLSVTRNLGLKEPVTGTSELITSEVAEDLTYYFAQSEQTPSSVALGVLVDEDGSVKEAGGFIIQVMPGIEESVIAALENSIGNITSITDLLRRGLTPEDILGEVLGFMEPTILDKVETRFHCGCSRDSLARAIVSLGREELQGLIDAGEPIEGVCDYCNEHYWFEPQELEDLLATT